MDHSASFLRALALDEVPQFEPAIEDDAKPEDLRKEERVRAMIRSAKLISKQGEFVCVVRDVSRSGVGVRLFHSLPDEPQMALQMPSGTQYEVCPVRSNESEAGFQFVDAVNVDNLIAEATDFPKRPLRFGIHFPVHVNAKGERWEGVVANISQQGAGFECEGLLAIDQPLTLVGVDDAKGLIEVTAKIRWRADGKYGAVFDNTLSMSELAELCVQLQSPTLAIK